MYSRLKTFLRQELDVLFAVNFFDLISFHLNLFRCNRKIRTRLKTRSKPYNSDLIAQDNYLKKDGKILFNFNDESPGIYFSSELLGYFNGMNYVVEGNNILIENQTT